MRHIDYNEIEVMCSICGEHLEVIDDDLNGDILEIETGKGCKCKCKAEKAKWVSVNKSLPGLHETVYVVDADGNSDLAWLVDGFDGYRFKRWDWNTSYGLIRAPITHWHTLPELPEA